MLNPTPTAPQKLGRYELVHPIASGGMATVYLARSAGIGGFERLVAVKVCHPHLRADADFAAMFLDEARLAARIHHPNVVPVLDVGDDGALFFVMEYVEGVALADLLKTSANRMPLAMVVRIVLDLLAGLHAAHELRGSDGQLLNVVHRDVSPQNVLVGSDGISRVVDFGVAKAEARATVTKGGEVKGKIGYMPPEQFLGSTVTRQADLYSAGVVLWECLAAERLFVADSDAAVMNMVLRGQVRPWPKDSVPVPAALEAIVRRALATRVEDRFATAKEMLLAMEACGIEPASARDVGSWVEHASAQWLADRRKLVLTVSTKVGQGRRKTPRHASSTLMNRWTAGQVVVVSRKWLIVGATAAGVGLAVLLWALWPPQLVPTVPPLSPPSTSVFSPPVTPTVVQPQPAPPVVPSNVVPPVVVSPAVRENKPKQLRKPIPRGKSSAPVHVRKPGGEFRPTEL
jgi:eukaryotic-like serine/threonine-protein kinase